MHQPADPGTPPPSTATPAATGGRALPDTAAPAGRAALHASSAPPAPATPAAAPPATPAAAAPAPRPVPAPPSIHVRAVITWLAIFPLVAIGLILLGPVVDSWHPVLRALVLTLVVVPLAVYLVVPQLMRAYGALRRRRAR